MKTITYDDTKWKLVPIEPTEEMIEAMQSSGWMLGNYKRMLAAAPSTPAAEPVFISHFFRLNQMAPAADRRVPDPITMLVQRDGEIIALNNKCAELERERDEHKMWRDTHKTELNWLKAQAGEPDPIYRLLASAWYYGNWKAETANEREMQRLMEQAGWWPVTEDRLIATAPPTTPAADQAKTLWNSTPNPEKFLPTISAAEPVAWYFKANGKVFLTTCTEDAGDCEGKLPDWKPLYTHPAAERRVPEDDK